MSDKILERMKEPVEVTIEEMEEAVKQNSTIRRRLITQLSSACDDLVITGADDAKTVEAKVMVHQAVDSMMSSSEMSFDRLAKLRLKRTQTNTDEQAAKLVGELLQKIDLRDPTGGGDGTKQDPEEVNKALADRIEKEGITVSEAEKEIPAEETKQEPKKKEEKE